MRVPTFLLFVVALAACQSTVPRTDPAMAQGSAAETGLSQETAIVIRASSSAEGVPQEYAWLRQHLPDGKIKKQALIMGSKPYDMFEVEMPDGQIRHVYFDISSFFGRGP